MQSNTLRAEIVSIDAIRPYIANSRTHSATQRERLKRFIERYGQVDPIIVGDDGEIVDGHLLFEILRETGCTHVAIRRASEFSPQQQRTLRIARNQLFRGSSWDLSLLASELSELQGLDIDLASTGLSEQELQRVLDLTIDAKPEARLPVSKPGDRWILGRHRVACGASLSVLGDLLGGALIRVVWLNEASHAQDEGCEPCKRRDISPELVLLHGYLHDGAAIFVPSQALDLGPILRAASELHFEHVTTAVALRSVPVDGILYQSEHVPVCVFKFGTADFVTSRRRSRLPRGDVWSSPKYDEGAIVASALSSDMIAEALRDTSRKDDVMVDTALQDGNALLAAENTGRVCVSIGQTPTAIDAAIQDWQRASGEVARHAESGLTFSELASARLEASSQ